MRRNRALPFLAVAAVAAAALVAVYLLMVRTEWGQTFDDLALAGREASRAAATRRSWGLLQTVTQASLALVAAILAGIALLRRRVRLAAAVVVAIGGAVVSAELIKHVATRPQLTASSVIDHNSYPSGHATIGCSLALATILVVAHRWRWLASLGAAFVVTAFGSAVVTAGWHRPSDTLGAYALSLAWFCLVSAALVAWRGAGDLALLRGDHDEEALGLRRTIIAGLAVLGVLLVGVVASIGGTGATGRSVTFHYVVALAVIDAVGVVVVAAFHLLSRNVAFDPPDGQAARDDRSVM